MLSQPTIIGYAKLLATPWYTYDCFIVTIEVTVNTVVSYRLTNRPPQQRFRTSASNASPPAPGASKRPNRWDCRCGKQPAQPNPGDLRFSSFMVIKESTPNISGTTVVGIFTCPLGRLVWVRCGCGTAHKGMLVGQPLPCPIPAGTPTAVDGTTSFFPGECTIE